MNSEEFRETFLRNDREGPTKAEKAEKMAGNNAWEGNSRRGISQPRAAGAREATPVGSVRSTGREENNAPREAKRKAGPSGQKEKQRKETESSRERRIPQRRAGRTRPKKNSHRADKNRGLRKAPEASGGSTQRTSKKAGRLSRR